MAGVTLSRVNKTFAGHAAVKDVSLDLYDGEFLVLVGPSGCGKTTLLRMIAGLEPVTSGSVFIGDRDVTALPPKQRDIAMVFQDYALYPHLTVEQNLGIGLKLRRVPKAERAKRVLQVAEILGLATLLKRKPAQLSGGQQQRVAIGRAMVREPAVYLLDEPLSNLDAQLRAHTRAELARLRDRLRVTTVYVTHDQIEAMTLGDRVAVLKDGVLQQIATPRELFDHPENAFVAGFIGSPDMNLVHADVVERRLLFGGHDLPVPAGVTLPSGRVIVGIRPSRFSQIRPDAPPATPRMDVTVDVVELLGEEMRVMFPVAARSGAVFGSVPSPTSEPDASELMAPAGASAGPETTVFAASLAPNADISSGRRLTLAVDTSALHFFDSDTGQAIRPHVDAPPAEAHSSFGANDVHGSHTRRDEE